MFEKSKYKNYYTGGLVIIVALIWGYNIFQFTDMAKSNEKLLTVKRDLNLLPVNLEITDTASYSFNGNYRDPFSYSYLKASERKKTDQKSPQPKPKKVKPEIKLPAIKLTGIIENTAILKMPNNTVHFLEQGQGLKDLHIQKVWRDSVAILFKDKSFTLKISK